LREGVILKRVVKRHLLGARIRENAAKTRGEGVVQTIIGPESEDTAGALLVRFDLALAVRCCGPAFATSRMNRSKRGHAS
jgi:hypothetical protein